MLRQNERINKHAKERKHMATHGDEDVCKGNECASNLGLSNNMGRVAEVSSLCLDCQGRRKKKKEKKRGISMHMELAAGKPYK